MTQRPIAHLVTDWALLGRAAKDAVRKLDPRGLYRNPVGSALVGQSFARPDLFWGRPSATAAFPYNGAASGGSNLGPLDPRLRAAAAARAEALRRGDQADGSLIPVDLVTASASGLDPHISPAAAHFQVARVASSRGLAEDVVHRLVEAHTDGRLGGVLGEPRVNVLLLDLALTSMDAEAGN